MYVLHPWREWCKDNGDCTRAGGNASTSPKMNENSFCMFLLDVFWMNGIDNWEIISLAWKMAKGSLIVPLYSDGKVEKVTLTKRRGKKVSKVLVKWEPVNTQIKSSPFYFLFLSSFLLLVMNIYIFSYSLYISFLSLLLKFLFYIFPDLSQY